MIRGRPALTFILYFALISATASLPKFWQWVLLGYGVFLALNYFIRVRPARVLGSTIVAGMKKMHRESKSALIIGFDQVLRSQGIPRGERSRSIATYAAEIFVGEDRVKELSSANDRSIAQRLIAPANVTEEDRKLAGATAWALGQVFLHSAAKNGTIPPGEAANAIRLLLRATSLWPVSKTFQTLAQAYISIGDLENGYRAATRAIELDESDGEAYRMKANAAGLLGRYDEAQNLFFRASMLLPESAQPLIHASLREVIERRGG